MAKDPDESLEGCLGAISFATAGMGGGVPAREVHIADALEKFPCEHKLYALIADIRGQEGKFKEAHSYLEKAYKFCDDSIKKREYQKGISSLEKRFTWVELVEKDSTARTTEGVEGRPFPSRE